MASSSSIEEKRPPCPTRLDNPTINCRINLNFTRELYIRIQGLYLLSYDTAHDMRVSISYGPSG